jgi:hypothetical protein
MVVGLRLELITEATPHTNETMLLFYLQIFNIYYMNWMNLLCCLHKSSRYSSGMIQRHHFGTLYSIENLEAEELWRIHSEFSSILPYLPLTQLADLAQIFNYFRTWVW